MAQVVIKAADNDSIPEPKPSVGEMGTSHEKRMSTSRSQGASVRTDSQRWKVGLPYAVMFGELRLEVSKEKNVAVEFCLKLYVFAYRPLSPGVALRYLLAQLTLSVSISTIPLSWAPVFLFLYPHRFLCTNCTGCLRLPGCLWRYSTRVFAALATSRSLRRWSR